MTRKPQTPGSGMSKSSSASDKQKRHAATIEGKATDVTPKSTEPAETKAGSKEPSKPKDSGIKPSGSVTGSERASAETLGSKNQSDKSASKSEKQSESGDSQPVEENYTIPLVSHLGAGFAGGLMVLAGIWLFSSDSVSNTPTSKAIEPIAERVGLLEQSVQTQLQDRLKALEVQLGEQDKLQTGLAQQLKKIEELGGGQPEQVAQLVARLDKLEASLAAGGSSVSQAGGSQNLQNLNEKIATVEQQLSKEFEDFKTAFYLRLDNLPAAGEREQTDTIRADIQSRTENLRSELEQLRNQGSGVSREIQSIEAISNKLVQEIETIRSNSESLSKKVAEVNQKLASVQDESVKSAQLNTAVAPISSRLKDLETNLSGILDREKLRQEDVKKAALTISLANLKRKIDQGQGFGSELNAVKSLAPATLDLKGLGTYQTKGISTPDSLKAAFNSKMDEALRSVRKSDGDTVLNRILSNAKSVVRVRRTGDVEGESIEAVLARMEVHVKSGEFAEALKESEGLEGPALDIFSDWLIQVQSRLAVVQAMQSIESELASSIMRTVGQGDR